MDVIFDAWERPSLITRESLLSPLCLWSVCSKMSDRLSECVMSTGGWLLVTLGWTALCPVRLMLAGVGGTTSCDVTKHRDSLENILEHLYLK